jgi:hypothetical protein
MVCVLLSGNDRCAHPLAGRGDFDDEEYALGAHDGRVFGGDGLVGDDQIGDEHRPWGLYVHGFGDLGLCAGGAGGGLDGDVGSAATWGRWLTRWWRTPGAGEVIRDSPSSSYR